MFMRPYSIDWGYIVFSLSVRLSVSEKKNTWTLEMIHFFLYFTSVHLVIRPFLCYRGQGHRSGKISGSHFSKNDRLGVISILQTLPLLYYFFIIVHCMRIGVIRLLDEKEPFLNNI